MSGNVVILPVVRIDRGAVPDKHPATALADRLTATLAGADVIHCTDALTRMLAAICTVNTINKTAAIELAEAIGADLVALVRGDDAPAPKGEQNGVQA